MRKIFLVLTIVFVLSIGCLAQNTCPNIMPAGTVCILQATANQAVIDKKELESTKKENSVLQEGLKDKDKSIAELKDTNNKNVADLTDRIHQTEVKLATTSGQLIGSEAEKTRLLAIIDALLKMVREKKIGLINF